MPLFCYTCIFFNGINIDRNLRINKRRSQNNFGFIVFISIKFCVAAIKMVGAGFLSFLQTQTHIHTHTANILFISILCGSILLYRLFVWPRFKFHSFVTRFEIIENFELPHEINYFVHKHNNCKMNVMGLILESVEKADETNIFSSLFVFK